MVKSWIAYCLTGVAAAWMLSQIHYNHNITAAPNAAFAYKPPEYVKAFFEVINRDQVNENYRQALK